MFLVAADLVYSVPLHQFRRVIRNTQDERLSPVVTSETQQVYTTYCVPHTGLHGSIA
jgi:hypothetical protein